MYASKTDHLISRVDRAFYAKQPCQAFKPAKDTRHVQIRTHQGRTLDALSVERSSDIIKYLKANTALVAIDEGQLFDEQLPQVVTTLSKQGLTVVVAGLPLDWRGLPWPPMPEIMALAHVVTQLYAVCVMCGADATRSQRLTHNMNRIDIGGEDKYEARCTECFNPDLALPTTNPA